MKRTRWIRRALLVLAGQLLAWHFAAGQDPNRDDKSDLPMRAPMRSEVIGEILAKLSVS